ncbi:hypothetical protein ACJX0J_006654, partial [Zea mays]
VIYASKGSSELAFSRLSMGTLCFTLRTSYINECSLRFSLDHGTSLLYGWGNLIYYLFMLFLLYNIHRRYCRLMLNGLATCSIEKYILIDLDLNILVVFRAIVPESEKKSVSIYLQNHLGPPTSQNSHLFWSKI